MFLLEDWNSSAFVVLALLLIVPVFLIHFVLFRSLLCFPASNRFLKMVRSKNKLLYLLTHAALLAISGALYYLLANFVLSPE